MRTLTAWSSALLLLVMTMSPVLAHDGGSGDAGSGGDADEKGPLMLGEGQYHGTLGLWDHGDHYQTTLPAGKGLVVAFHYSEYETMLRVYGAYDQAHLQPWDQAYLGGEGETVFDLMFHLMGGGSVGPGGLDLSIAIESAYGFSIRFVDLAAQDDAGSGRDTGMVADTAVTIAEGTYAAMLGGFDPADLYRIDAVAGRTYTATVEASVLYLTTSLSDQTGAQHHDAIRTTKWTATADGPIYLNVQAHDTTEYAESYTVTVTSEEAAGLPNLHFEEVTIAEADDTHAWCGGGSLVEDLFMVEVLLGNDGVAPADPSTLVVEVWMDGFLQGNGCAMATEVPMLAPGEAHGFVFAFSVPETARGVTVIAILDDAGHVQESDEDDNRVKLHHETTLGGLLP